MAQEGGSALVESVFSREDGNPAIREGGQALVASLCGRKDVVRANRGPRVVGLKALLDSGVICLNRIAVPRVMRK